MSEVTPTRSAVIERKEERHAMHEGYVFLDEKTMLLAGEIVRQLRAYEALAARLAETQRAAVAALAASIAVTCSAVNTSGPRRSKTRKAMTARIAAAATAASHQMCQTIAKPKAKAMAPMMMPAAVLRGSAMAR